MTGSGALEGLVVVELAGSVPGESCGRLLSDAGADVIKLEGPGGSALRRWSASGRPIAPDDDGALFQYLGASKQSIVIDPCSARGSSAALDIIQRADAVVWSRDWELATGDGFSAEEISRAAPAAIVTAITPFGLTGPWAHAPATDFTLQSWVGGPATRGRLDQPPISVGGRPAEWTAGVIAGIGTLAALRRRMRTGRGELLDVSLLETMILIEDMYPVTYYSLAGRAFHGQRFTNLPDIEPTKDGWIGFMIITAQQWMDFCAMIERPDLAEDQALFRYDNRNARRDELEASIRGWTTKHTTAEIFELGGLFRVPVAPVGNGAKVLEFEHLQVTGAFRSNSRAGFSEPEVPYIMSRSPHRPRAPAPHLAEHADLDYLRQRDEPMPKLLGTTPDAPLEGLRVIDLTQFWAGPMAGHILAMLGAEVVHLESIQRIDGMRLISHKSADDDKFWEWSPLFHGSNSNKLGLTLNLGDSRGVGVLQKLVQSCDILVENFSPRVFDNWGISYDDLAAINPGLIVVRMPAFGLDGPWRDQVGYAQTMEQISGLAWMTGFPGDQPRVPNGQADPIAGIHAAFACLVAVEHRRRTGEGQLVELPMVRTALAVAAEQIIEYSANRAVLKRQGNRGPQADPQGFYRCANDPAGIERWVAIAVEDDTQWLRFLAAVDAPDWMRSPSLDTVDGRRSHADDIDDWISTWAETQCGDAIVRLLWRAGVPASKLLMPHEQADIPQLAARGWWQKVEHPVAGPLLLGGFPVKFEAGPHVWHRTPPPTLGQHNHEVLSNWLGLTDGEIADLAAHDVIGIQPVGTTRMM
jgi:crotonobetainyl-CoA:carnitine CoA-transferase CaiB-like acyl-CoA transferase